jgi:DNA adenine methylase
MPGTAGVAAGMATSASAARPGYATGDAVGSGYWITQPVPATLDSGAVESGCAGSRERPAMAGYFGGKDGAGVFQAIVAQMPPHDTYIEAFAGGAAVFRNMPKPALAYLIERDPKVVTALHRMGLDALVVPGDALPTVAGFDYAAAGRVLIYADPPYVQSTRGAKRYRFDMSDAEHERLAQVLRSVPACVIVSGYPSALYDRLYGDWRTVEFQTMTRGGVRTEKLWLNFPAGKVQWARFAGRDRTQRQHIKRKAARWAAKFAAMPEGDRLAVLAAIMDAA